MTREAEKLVEILGPCTEDIRDCEIMRTAIALEKSEAENERAQAIRHQLVKLACKNCIGQYLADVK